MDPLVLFAALGPLVVDAGKSLIAKFIGSEFKPANIADWLAMQKMDIEKFTTMNAAGGSALSYPWVEAVIRLQRPSVALIALCVWAWSRLYGLPSDAVDNFAGAVGFYLFGDRTLFYVSKAKKNESNI